MTTADAVRVRLGLGRLLPLGGPGDGAWLTERAAVAVLRRAAAGIPGAALGKVRLALADPAEAGVPAVPPPPSALPPGALRIEAEFEATHETGNTAGAGAGDEAGAVAGAVAAVPRPLPDVADALREALFSAAMDSLDLAVEAVDLRVTALVETVRGAPGGPASSGPEAPAEESDREPLARAVASVPGVARLTSLLGAAVRVTPGDVRVEVAIVSGRRPLDVVRAVRAAVTSALGDDRPVAVVVTDASG
ncbi:hypothetical protein GCM10010387_43080 [Streptomyces inusitatus]|uniref:Nucleopolyhedrovirus P10 family protein n=1 Tax=Streptomyces inusitatus TaxID=68221 RepID=A0A918UZ37_9ACTN|nr:hypothetical protein [Streptomyces inusitatus]GGZ44098.1 hypothetical protein GCM10010387_43080 [Streptomyces inusitatus]